MLAKHVDPASADRAEKARRREERRLKRELRAARRAQREEVRAKLDAFCRRELGAPLAEVIERQRRRYKSAGK